MPVPPRAAAAARSLAAFAPAKSLATGDSDSGFEVEYSPPLPPPPNPPPRGAFGFVGGDRDGVPAGATAFLFFPPRPNPNNLPFRPFAVSGRCETGAQRLSGAARCALFCSAAVVRAALCGLRGASQ
eukprot:29215-Pelagococcus_subviridis.AAC.10